MSNYFTYDTRRYAPKPLREGAWTDVDTLGCYLTGRPPRPDGDMFARVSPRSSWPKLEPSPAPSVEEAVIITNSEEPFKPAKLIEVSTMHVIDGSRVKEGYCALSYVWAQSGDYYKESETVGYVRVDKGLHKIIEYEEADKGRARRGRKPQCIRKPRIKYVDYKGLIQRVCNDFGVKYIWYDLMCFEGLEGEAKKHELRQMHKIYHNADWTIVMVPELKTRIRGERSQYFPVDSLTPQKTKRGVEFYKNNKRVSSTRGRIIHPNDVDYSLWRTRSWTLEEAVMSKKLLFVGRDVHMTSDVVLGSPYSSDYLKNLCEAGLYWNSCMLSWDMNRRSSSKAHDMFFALTNIRSDFMNEIPFEYKEDVLALAVKFYNLLAKQDLTMLCFGCPEYYTFVPREQVEGEQDTEQEIERNSEQATATSTEHATDTSNKRKTPLPSWWFHQGRHVKPEYARLMGTSFGVDKYFFTDEGMLHLTCHCITVTLGENIVDDISIAKVANVNPYAMPLNHAISPGAPPHIGYYRSIDFYEQYHGLPLQRPVFVESAGPQGLVFVDTKGWYIKAGPTPSDYGLQQTHVLRLQQNGEMWTNETVQSADTIGAYLSLIEPCSECVILYELSFSTKDPNWRIHPVVVQDDDCDYRSIGLCLMFDGFQFVDVETECLDISIK